MARIVKLALLVGIAGWTTTFSAPGGHDRIGGWRIESIDGQPVVAGSRADIEFGDEGRVGGHASCNRFTGTYRLPGSELVFGAMAATKMTCPDALMDQEMRFPTAPCSE